MNLTEGGAGDKNDQISEDARVSDGLPPHLPTTFAELTAKDVDRLNRLVRRDFTRIRLIVSALCGPTVDVEGVVAEATARAVERLMSGRSIEVLTAWISTTAVNLGRSELRRQAVRRRHASSISISSEGDSGLESIAPRMDVRNALKELPRRQAEIVALYYGLDLSIAEIAGTIGRSEGTVKATLFKARASLAVALGMTEEDEHDGKD